MLSKQGMTVKNYLKIILAVLIPIAAFPIDPILNNANELYRNGKYEEAYEDFSWFIFQLGRSCSDEDYYIALIGKNSCMKHLSSEKLFQIEQEFFSYFIDAYFPNWQKPMVLRQQLLMRSIKDSVYFSL